MTPEQDARNLRKSKLLPAVIAEFRAMLIERLLASDDLVAARAGVLIIDEFAETLNGRIEQHAGDGDAGDGND
jgi:hypothetical protein